MLYSSLQWLFSLDLVEIYPQKGVKKLCIFIAFVVCMCVCICVHIYAYVSVCHSIFTIINIYICIAIFQFAHRHDSTNLLFRLRFTNINAIYFLKKMLLVWLPVYIKYISGLGLKQSENISLKNIIRKTYFVISF